MRRRVVLLVVNVVATALTLLTSVRENTILALMTGRFGLVRARLRDGRISLGISATAFQQVPPNTLPDLVTVADDFKFHSGPTRSPASLGEDRSTCIRVNSMSAAVLAVYFDDPFGSGPRREQVFLWSISAPQCDVVNLQPTWLQTQCEGNTTACDAYLLAHFDELQRNRTVQVGVPVDFGVEGVPYLRCTGRPATTGFQYLTDLLVFQSFWAGGSFQVEVQTSVCIAEPAAFDAATDHGLFRVRAADQESTIAVAVPATFWLISFVSSVYSAVYLAFLVRGVILVALSRHQYVSYYPATTKYAILGRFGDWVPSTLLLSWIIPIKDHTKAFRFHAKTIVAANMWLNEWVYIGISVADACVNIRSVYMLLTMGAWMLTKRVTLENFVFVCTPLTKMAWITCFGHTVFQRFMRILLNTVRAFVWNDRVMGYIDGIRWYIDAVALLTTFKFYLVALVLQLYVVLKIKGSPTISTRAADAKRPVYGGYTNLTTAWQCEIAVDMLFIVAVQIVVAHVVGALVLRTKLRRMTHNRVLRILQRRYFFVGWDAFVTMDALGIEPFAPPFVDVNGHEVAVTNCSAGALLRQLASSGPSGWVRLAGEHGFVPAPEVVVDDKKQESDLNYPLGAARDMGIFRRRSRRQPSTEGQRDGSEKSSGHFLRVTHSMRTILPEPTPVVSPPTGDENVDPPQQERVYHAHAESLWGGFVLVDFVRDSVRFLGQQPNTEARSKVDQSVQHQNWVDMMEDQDESHVVVVHDALASLTADDCKRLLSGDLRLRIC